MALYNEQNTNSTTTCLTESSNGSFCALAETQTKTIYNWFDTVYLYSKILIGFVIVAIIINMMRRKK